MNNLDQATIMGMEALRKAVILTLTGSTNEDAMLKEHYDSLSGQTNISKKTLRRFFKSKAHVGPQTRNLLAAIALGKADEIDTPDFDQHSFYLDFLNTVDNVPPTKAEPSIVQKPIWHFGQILAQKYQEIQPEYDFSALNCVRVNIGMSSRLISTSTQEVELNTSLLTRHSRVIVTGDPGMGKTKFSQHLCYSWSLLYDPDQDIPIYIDLKSDSFNKQGLGIRSFILDQYFDAESDWMVQDFLDNNVSSYYFLFDGFDDLTSKEKESLMHEVESFTHPVNYIILSRPYGFQDFDYPTNTLYNIHGLNLSSQEKFVKDCLTSTETELDYTLFLTYIYSNEILSTLARCPMHLYRLVTLTAKTKSFKLLQQINSGIKLQQLFNKYVN